MPIDRSVDTLAARRAGLQKTTGSLAPVKGRCGRHLTYTDPPKYCMRFPMRGRDYCYTHRKRMGIANPSFKTGRWSRDVPKRIAADYERLLHDDQLLSLRREIARQRAYYYDLERRMEDGAVASKALLRAAAAALEAWRKLDEAEKNGSEFLMEAMSKARATMRKFGEALAPAVQETEARAELRTTWLVLERLTRAENLRVESLYNMITSERALAIRHAETTATMEGLEHCVRDVAERMAVRRYVAARLGELAGRRDHPALDAAGGPVEEPAADPEAGDRR
jgi:hypothetical protein